MSKFKIKNRWLALLALFFIGFFIYLGVWQLNRAKVKQQLIATYEERITFPPLSSKAFPLKNDLRYYRLTISGHFDNQHTFLLDNKIFHQQVGYEVYTPFISPRLPPILIDRGFIPLGTNRQVLPLIPAIQDEVTITGMLNLPPTYFALGKIVDETHLTWPLRVQFIHLSMMANLFKRPFMPYVLILAPNNPYGLPCEWQIATMSPSRHQGYALQWFAFAFTLLILFVALNRD